MHVDTAVQPRRTCFDSCTTPQGCPKSWQRKDDRIPVISCGSPMRVDTGVRPRCTCSDSCTASQDSPEKWQRKDDPPQVPSPVSPLHADTAALLHRVCL